MRKFDFNAIDAPKMEITLKTGDMLTLEIPSVSLIEHLKDSTKRLSRTITEKNLGELKRYYELAAELLSCNAEGIPITADNLETKQNFGIEHLVAFFTAYLEFVNEAGNAKN